MQVDNDVVSVVPEVVEPRTFGVVDALPTNARFETESSVDQNIMGVIDRMMRPDDFLKKLRMMHDNRMDIMVSNVDDLNLQHVRDEERRRVYFAIKPNPRLFPVGSKAREWFEEYEMMEIDDTGVRSMCHQINRSWSTMLNFDNPAGRLLSEFHDWFRSSNAKSLVVRTNTSTTERARLVDAFVPGNLNLASNFEMMTGIFERLTHCYGDCIRGVQTLHGSTPENLCYRVLFGNPIAVEGSDIRKANFMMLNYMGSEHGLNKTELDLGMWRLVCANGAMRKDLSIVRAVWGRFNTMDKFMYSVDNLVELSGHYAGSMTRKIEELRNTALIADPMLMLETLRAQRLIDSRHFETAAYAVDRIEENTNWGMMNLLTDAAKTHGDMRKRTTAETNSLMLAMQPQSFNGIVSDGFSEVRAKLDLRNELATTSR